MMIILHDNMLSSTQIVEIAGQLVIKDDTPIEKSPSPGNVKLREIRDILTFYIVYFIFVGHMWKVIFSDLISGEYKI